MTGLTGLAGLRRRVAMLEEAEADHTRQAARKDLTEYQRNKHANLARAAARDLKAARRNLRRAEKEQQQ